MHQQSYQWPQLGQHFETGGRSGEAVDLAPAKELMEQYQRWLEATTIKA